VVVLTELHSANSWFPKTEFKSPRKPASTWKINDQLDLYHYKRLSDFWKCSSPNCGLYSANTSDCCRGCGRKTMVLRSSGKRSSEVIAISVNNNSSNRNNSNSNSNSKSSSKSNSSSSSSSRSTKHVQKKVRVDENKQRQVSCCVCVLLLLLWLLLLLLFLLLLFFM
jgi:cobalamin biosynthesis Mg chelatase CobN